MADIYKPRPDCARCGKPYHKHNVGALTTCPMVATYLEPAALLARASVSGDQ